MKWQVITDTMQGIGGVAGVIALGWQIIDFRARRRIVRWPPELRPLLINAVRLMDEIESGSHNQDMINKDLRTCIDDLNRMRYLAPLNHQGHIALVGSNLEFVYAADRSISVGRKTQQKSEEIAVMLIKQQEAAREAKKHCRELLHIIGATHS